MAERNPYLILGVDFAAGADDARRAFAVAARRARRQSGAWQVEDLTWALHEIEVLEAHPADLVHIYRVPADPGAFAPAATSGWGIFEPEPVAMDRTSPPASTGTIDVIRLGAVSEHDELILGLSALISQRRPIAYEFEETE